MRKDPKQLHLEDKAFRLLEKIGGRPLVKFSLAELNLSADDAQVVVSCLKSHMLVSCLYNITLSNTHIEFNSTGKM